MEKRKCFIPPFCLPLAKLVRLVVYLLINAKQKRIRMIPRGDIGPGSAADRDHGERKKRRSIRLQYRGRGSVYALPKPAAFAGLSGN